METVTEWLLHGERKLADGESSYRNDGEKVMAARYVLICEQNVMIACFVILWWLLKIEVKSMGKVLFKIPMEYWMLLPSYDFVWFM